MDHSAIDISSKSNLKFCMQIGPTNIWVCNAAFLAFKSDILYNWQERQFFIMNGKIDVYTSYSSKSFHVHCFYLLSIIMKSLKVLHKTIACAKIHSSFVYMLLWNRRGLQQINIRNIYHSWSSWLNKKLSWKKSYHEKNAFMKSIKKICLSVHNVPSKNMRNLYRPKYVQILFDIMSKNKKEIWINNHEYWLTSNSIWANLRWKLWKINNF